MGNPLCSQGGMFVEGEVISGVLTNDTYQTGKYIDMQPGGKTDQPTNGVAFGELVCTTASGGSDAVVTLTLEVETDDNSSFTSAISLGTKTYADAMGATDGIHKMSAQLPFNARQCERYVRAKVKQTKAGTVTVSVVGLAGGIVRTQAGNQPNENYSDLGYSRTLD